MVALVSVAPAATSRANRGPFSFPFMNPLTHPSYHLFSPWEDALVQIISRYPEPSNVYVGNRSPSTVRQGIQQALRLFITNPSFSSKLTLDQALLVENTFVFGNNPDGSIYIGPRRPRGLKSNFKLGFEQPASPPIPPIDCSNPVTFHAILHLKNFDHLPVPIIINNFTLPSDFNETYPNIELVSNADGSATIL